MPLGSNSGSSLCTAGTDLCHSLPTETNTQAVFHSLDRRQRQALDSKAMRVFATWTILDSGQDRTPGLKKGTEPSATRYTQGIRRIRIWNDMEHYGAMHPFDMNILFAKLFWSEWLLLEFGCCLDVASVNCCKTTVKARQQGFLMPLVTRWLISSQFFAALSCSARISQPIPQNLKIV